MQIRRKKKESMSVVSEESANCAQIHASKRPFLPAVRTEPSLEALFRKPHSAGVADKAEKREPVEEESWDLTFEQLLDQWAGPAGEDH